MKLRFLAIFILIFSTMLYSQNTIINNKNTVDLLKPEIENSLTFNGTDDYKSPLLSLGKKYDPYGVLFEYYPYTIKLNQNQKTTVNSLSIANIKNDINNAFSIYRQVQNKYDLGVISQILGYTGAAAAVGLAIYHVHKYQSHYGLKKKK